MKMLASWVFVIFALTTYSIGWVIGVCRWSLCEGINDADGAMDTACDYLLGADHPELYSADFSECPHGEDYDYCPRCIK